MSKQYNPRLVGQFFIDEVSGKKYKVLLVEQVDGKNILIDKIYELENRIDELESWRREQDDLAWEMRDRGD